MLKFFLLAALYITSFTPAEKVCLRQITIRHIGMEDMHVATLILSTKTLRRVDADDMYPTKLVLAEEEFTRVAHLFKAFDPSTHRQLPNSGDAPVIGTFNVEVFDACKKISDNSYQPKRSEALFRFLLKNLNRFEPNNRKEVEMTLKGHVGP